MKNTIIVLDSERYKSKEKTIRDLFEENVKNKIYYTEYEDELIRKVCKWKYVGEILLHILYWVKSFRYAKKIYKENNGGKIITINPIVGIFLGILNKNHKYEILLSGFLFEPKNNQIYYKFRIWFVKKAINGIDKLIVYANKEVQYYRNIFKMDKFTFVPYGIDFDIHEPYVGKLPETFIFSGGRSNRDYHALINAYNLLGVEEIKLCIATRPSVVQQEDLSQIILLKDVVLETFGSAMEKAKFVVLPLKETDISAGHQVLLEALERNQIIIVSDIDAVKDYVSSEQVIFFESGNSDALCQTMRFVLENYDEVKQKYSQNREYYLNNYTFVNFFRRLVNL